jgi:hypothetical protein
MTSTDTTPDISIHTVGFLVEGLDSAQLADLRASGVDHGGNPVESFVDADGGWPLRCCLTDSVPGDEVAIVAWSPYTWDGPYRETGPVVIHAHDCGGVKVAPGALPAQFLTRPQRVRPYGYDHRIAYDHIRLVPGDGTLPMELSRLLEDPSIDVVQVRNPDAGCYSFTARRP